MGRKVGNAGESMAILGNMQSMVNHESNSKGV